MDIKEAIIKRHSVRRYLDKQIEENVANELKAVINDACQESGLDIQLVLNESLAFTGFLAKYGKFENCKNYITICGKGGGKLTLAILAKK